MTIYRFRPDRPPINRGTGRVQGSGLTSMQYGMACGKNRMNSSFIFKSKPNPLYWWFDSVLPL